MRKLTAGLVSNQDLDFTWTPTGTYDEAKGHLPQDDNNRQPA